MGIVINKIVIDSFVFAGGESQVNVKKVSLGESCEILAKLTSANDIMQLLLAVDAIRRINPLTRISLEIPYFPYARQDRVCEEGEALSVKVITDLINSLKCELVTITDPHSDVTPALLNNCKVKTQADIIHNSILANFIREDNVTLLAPDAGAEKKARLVAQKFREDGHAVDLIFASKKRDPKTGEISEIRISDNVKNKKVLIVDDICDGGRTFIELAKVLKKEEATDLYLYTTHGIYSRGLSELKKYFTRIFCFNDLRSDQQSEPDLLTVLKEQSRPLTLQDQI